MFLCPLDVLFKYSLITIRPAYSPWAPELGCKEVPLKPVISFNCLSSFFRSFWYPNAWSNGTKGWILFHLLQLIGIISDAAFSFIVQDPKEIMEWVRDRSFLSKFFIYLIKAVSEWYLLKTSEVMKLDFLLNSFGIFNSSDLDSISNKSISRDFAIVSTIFWISFVDVASLIEIEIS